MAEIILGFLFFEEGKRGKEEEGRADEAEAEIQNFRR